MATPAATAPSTTTRPARRPARVLGVDIGGTGIKGAPVNTRKGELRSERHRILTPQPATPDAMSEVVVEIVKHFGWEGPVGVTFPGVVKRGVTMTAANLDKGWIGVDADAMLTELLGLSVHVINDADAAGLAEMKFGAGKGNDGVVILVTLGTGIGTAVFNNGRLVPNTELGHIEMHGKDAEGQAAESVRVRKGLSWKKFGGRVDDYLGRLENLLWPDLIIIGGGASQDAEKFLPHLSIRTPVVAATLLNAAGIVGGALAFEED
jgi:polyphosphate glucokinase